jgi:hypothetical protein
MLLSWRNRVERKEGGKFGIPTPFVKISSHVPNRVEILGEQKQMLKSRDRSSFMTAQSLNVNKNEFRRGVGFLSISLTSLHSYTRIHGISRIVEALHYSVCMGIVPYIHEW